MTPAEYLDSHSSDLLKLLRRLVRIPTVNPPGQNYAEIVGVLLGELEAVGLATRVLRPPPKFQRRILGGGLEDFPRSNVLGKWRVAGARRTVHFNAHFDVVPVSGNWRHGNPFGGEVERGWIFGRGTGDMKGSIASLLLALRALRHCRVLPRVNLEVSFTADEETDSLLGAGWLVEHAPISPDFAVVMEGGEEDAICCGHNGVVWLEVVVHGRAAHGSRPEMGINALEKMSALVLALEKYKSRLAQKTFLTPEGKTMVPTINLGGEFRSGPGGKINTVPAEARFSIDRRVLAIETTAQAESELRKFLISAARAIPDCSITINKVSENQPSFSLPKHPFFKAMAESLRRVRARTPVFSVSTGFNDMQFFSSLKIPTLGYGPGGENYHGVDERARVSDLMKTAKIYADLVTTFDG